MASIKDFGNMSAKRIIELLTLTLNCTEKELKIALVSDCAIDTIRDQIEWNRGDKRE